MFSFHGVAAFAVRGGKLAYRGHSSSARSTRLGILPSLPRIGTLRLALEERNMDRKWIAAIAAIGGIAVGALAGPAVLGATASESAAADGALADRIAIEDLVTRYYAHLGTNDAGAFGEYYTEDAVFDVNGVVSTGREEIEALYANMDEEGDSVANAGVFHMVLSNPVIDIDGDTATASFLWTGILNPDVSAPPQVAEHGREYDLLVKQDGKWLISKRVVIADSALPERFAATYEPRLDYDIRAD
jgi:uncharacterized protein (TIGR02246 family)